MPRTKYDDLDTHLRKWGLRVVEVTGWQNRSANWYKTFNPRAIICHHTAGSTVGNSPSLSLVKNGRPGITGPLSQFVLGRDGTVYLICAHRANHAGKGGPHMGIPRDSANAYAWGIEAENNGRGEKWSSEQLNAYYRLCAALMEYSNIPIHRVFGHREWTPRKIDPAGIDMDQFRERVKEAKKAKPGRKTVKAAQTPLVPTYSRLKYKNTHSHVGLLQKELYKKGHYKRPVNNFYDWHTRLAVQSFQYSIGLKGKDADGLMGPFTYEKLFGKKPNV